MRVHPVLEWGYRDVWCFLREVGIEYCGLYDEGFTSLGGLGDTKRNPRLRVDGEGEVYRPAWELVDEGEERAGRGVVPEQSAEREKQNQVVEEKNSEVEAGSI